MKNLWCSQSRTMNETREVGDPSQQDEDDYLAVLAEGGYMIQKIAQILHPGGQEMSCDQLRRH